MPHIRYVITLAAMLVLTISQVFAADYFVNAINGNDANSGKNVNQPIRSIEKINGLTLNPGDRILFAAGQTFYGELRLTDVQGSILQPITIDSYQSAAGIKKNFVIDAKGKANGVLLQDCSFLIIKHITIEADGYSSAPSGNETMRVGLMIRATPGKISRNIQVDSLEIKNIYFENKGFTRGADEVKTANGSQRYGWGIRIMADNPSAQITQVEVSHCRIRDVDHTGLKITGANKNIHWLNIHDNDIAYTGGPGIQMSEVKNIHVHNNTVDHSGSHNDSRKWGRGSGLWTWSSSQVLIENNRFTNADGPGDSAGAHIDYNCDHIVLQYNFSAKNAGGFCEILGNNYNCAYRYNISVNDGYRIKGQNGAFQEGKIFWLSGYQGNEKPRKGPVNSYFYNNTIYVDSTITAAVAIDKTSKGILIANNIFCIMGGSRKVLGDQMKADNGNATLDGPLLFSNNLWFSPSSWPADAEIQEANPRFGNPNFKNPGGAMINDYLPGIIKLVKQNGIRIQALPRDFLGLLQGMNPDKDILGNAIGNIPPIGAICPN